MYKPAYKGIPLIHLFFGSGYNQDINYAQILRVWFEKEQIQIKADDFTSLKNGTNYKKQ